MPALNAWFRNRPKGCRRCGSSQLIAEGPTAEQDQRFSVRWRCVECGSVTVIPPRWWQVWLVVLLWWAGLAVIPYVFVRVSSVIGEWAALVVCLAWLGVHLFNGVWVYRQLQLFRQTKES